VPGLAYRNLEAALAATLLAAFPQSAAPPGAHETLAELSERAHATYRAFVWEETLFPRFFRAFTPIDEVSMLALGSRPPRRLEAGPAKHGPPAATRGGAAANPGATRPRGRAFGATPGRR
jgi:phosphoenolpyruvate carboxylase